ncbi:putative sodium/potassium/calcium exchanger [Natrialba asiatica]|uniref:Uncharacterized protein n=1 Tax=Natrialba asiatica (strain ATCC 700177 / DSM 12278 / JCM 9576 / FERM P-10747 / NBRC 102637 / 172P1) TaxID=29540 RepID=M0AHH3_NATA1|nr:hypothetical protein [Natrialba asiatica]ELY97826.1 hypothetical protein C481_17860 [Natrialba asiatica DSM 12278]
MCPTFTADDAGKTVESSNGAPLGVVVSVEPETVYVDPDPGVTDSIKATLDWGNETEEPVPLTDDAVTEITDETIRLETAFPEESLASDEARVGGQSDATGKSHPRDANYTPGDPVTGTSTESETGVDGTEKGPGSTARDRSEPMLDDEFYDDLEDEPRIDPDEQPDETEPTADTAADETDTIEEEAGRGLEVDPSELTGRDPDAELDPDEDVGQRTDAEVEPEMELDERSDAELAPGNIDERRRDDAAVDPERIDSEVGAGAGVDEETDLEERERTEDADPSAEHAADDDDTDTADGDSESR